MQNSDNQKPNRNRYSATFRNGRMHWIRPSKPEWWTASYGDEELWARNELEVQERLANLEEEHTIVFNVLRPHEVGITVHQIQDEICPDGWTRDFVTLDDLYAILEDLIEAQLVFKKLFWLENDDNTEYHDYRTIHTVDEYWW